MSNPDLELRDAQLQAAAKAATQRKERIPFNVPRLRLYHDPIPGFHLAWINDEKGHVERALDGGYTFVEKPRSQKADAVARQGGGDLANMERRLVGVDDSGGPIYAYLMKIADDLHAEDMKVHEEGYKKVEQAINRTALHSDGMPDSIASNDRKNFYRPRKL